MNAFLEKTKKYLLNNIYIILILVLCGATFFWFKSDLIFNQDSGYLDISNEFRSTFSTWYPLNAPGTFEDRRFLFNFGYIFEYRLLTLLFSYPIAQRIMVYLLMLSGWLGVYFLCRVIKFKKSMSFMAGGLYVFNILALVSIWHYGSGTVTHAYAFIPFVIALFIKGTKENKGFLFALLTSCIMLYGFGVIFVNPVYAATILGFTFFYLLFNIFASKIDKNICFTRIKYYIFFVLTFILLNLVWIPNFISGSHSSIVGAFSTIDERNARMKILTESYEPTKLFNLLGFWAFFGTFDGREQWLQFSPYYKNPFILFLSYVLPFLVFASRLFKRKGKGDILFWYLSTVLSVGFIGVARFPDISEYFFRFMESNSFISTGYRNVLTKAAPILMMGYSILFAITVDSIASNFKQDHFRKIIYVAAFVLFIVVLPLPLWKGEQFKVKVDRLSSSHTKIPEYYKEAKEFFEEKKSDYRIAGLPVITQPHIDLNWEYGYNAGSSIAQLLLKPVLGKNSGSQYNQYIAIGSLIHGYKPNEQVPKLLSFYNVKSAIFFRDINWSVGIGRQYTLPNKLKTLENFLESNSRFFQYEKDIGQLSLYDLDIQYYLPHIYTAQSVIRSDQNASASAQIVMYPDYKIRSAIFFEEQNGKKLESLRVNELTGLEGKTPILEFKKINPTKYRIMIHGAKDSFPLVFSESYHEGWKLYVEKINQLTGLRVGGFTLSAVEGLNDYKILDGNEEDQASKEEIEKFIETGWVSTLGDGKEKKIEHMKYVRDQLARIPIFKWEEEKLDYIEKYKIDFISKNFQDTIQNDNLPNGKFYETWLAKKLTSSRVNGLTSLNKNALQLPDDNHLMANGYANSWIIDPKEICEGLKGSKVNGLCKKNPDGSYDMEMVVEFWPQRLFYIGLGISGTTLLSCIGYLIYDWRKRREFQARPVTS